MRKYLDVKLFADCYIRGSIVVSISACHAEDPGSIPGRGGFLCSFNVFRQIKAVCALARPAQSAGGEAGFVFSFLLTRQLHCEQMQFGQLPA